MVLKMNKESLKGLTAAHSWLGLIISFILYIVFLAGSYSFFMEDIAQWELGAQFPQPQQTEFMGAQELIDQTVDKLTIVPTDAVWLTLATNKAPFHDIMYSYIDSEGKTQSPDPVMDPVTGKHIYDFYDISLGRFFRNLHIDLLIPKIGNYLVGFVSLFFFVALISGIFIHWRKIYSHFFTYRTKRTRDKTLDSHNIIGVIGLPFHIIFALTGVLFNLGFIFEDINIAVFAQGDNQVYQQQTSSRAPLEAQPPSGIFMPMTGINELMRRSESEIPNFKVSRIEIMNWKNDNATILISGKIKDDFAKSTQIQYQMKTGKVIFQNISNNNTSADGMAVLDALHFADFSDRIIKVIFFLLGLGTCYVIISGNLLWIAKQEKRHGHTWTVKLVKRLSSSIFSGAFLATALCFIITRYFPINYENKEMVLCAVFYSVLLLCFLYSIMLTNQIKVTINILLVSSATFICVPLLDWISLSDGIINMIKLGRFQIIVIQSICIISAMICLLIAASINKKYITAVPNTFTLTTN